MKFYCRRYKLKSDPNLIFKVREEEYDSPPLHEEPTNDAWYWLDAVPFVEEYKPTV